MKLLTSDPFAFEPTPNKNNGLAMVDASRAWAGGGGVGRRNTTGGPKGWLLCSKMSFPWKVCFKFELCSCRLG